MGAMMPKGTQFVRTLSDKLEDYTVIFLLPIFFAYTGLRTQIGLIDNRELWFDHGADHRRGMRREIRRLDDRRPRVRTELARGRHRRHTDEHARLMELVILNIGLQEGVITPRCSR